MEALPIAIPLLAAALLAAIGSHVPRRVSDAIALLAAAASAVLSSVLLAKSRHGPLTYWLGGWQPRPGGIAIGIGLTVDPIGAGFAALSGVLVVAALCFALRLFDDVHAHFQVLMLAFLAALCGFGFSGDLGGGPYDRSSSIAALRTLDGRDALVDNITWRAAMGDRAIFEG